MGTYGNLLNLKKHEIFNLKKTSYRRKKEEERRTKQSLDSPQTIEANEKTFQCTLLCGCSLYLQNLCLFLHDFAKLPKKSFWHGGHMDQAGRKDNSTVFETE